MKKVQFYFTCLLFTLSIATQAQESQLEYCPMAQENKIWKIQIGGIKENKYISYVKGDTLINGETWKKVYNHMVWWNGIKNSYYAAIRDVGKKVYAIAKGSNKPRLLYDFGLQVGETVRCGIEGNAFACLLDKDEPLDTLLGFPFGFSLRVDRIETVYDQMQEEERRRFTLTLLDAFGNPLAPYVGTGNNHYQMEENIVWDEGYGSCVSPFSPWLLIPNGSTMLDCYVDEEKPSNPTKVVGNNQPLPSGNSILFNLLGRRLNDTPQNEVYIRDGKKHVGK